MILQCGCSCKESLVRTVEVYSKIKAYVKAKERNSVHTLLYQFVHSERLNILFGSKTPQK